jgi:hypothetical protein
MRRNLRRGLNNMAFAMRGGADAGDGTVVEGRVGHLGRLLLMEMVVVVTSNVCCVISKLLNGDIPTRARERQQQKQTETEEVDVATARLPHLSTRSGETPRTIFEADLEEDNSAIRHYLPS